MSIMFVIYTYLILLLLANVAILLSLHFEGEIVQARKWNKYVGLVENVKAIQYKNGKFMVKVIRHASFGNILNYYYR